MNIVTKANRDIDSLQPVAQVAARLFFEECKKRGIPVFATEYHRSQERQDYLYEQGRTRPGNVVTWTRSSNHTSGYAWDIAVSPPHDLYDAGIIAKAGQVARELGIEWGGDWKQKDTPHFQVAQDWKAPASALDKQYQKALDNLEQHGIITQKYVWWPKINKGNAKYLIQSFGNKVFGKHTYNESVQALAEHKISVSPLVWMNHTYSEENIKMLVINMAKYLG